LLPGDIERRAESRLLRTTALGRHELVVAPHHGSATSSSPPFVRAVRSRFVVFATGFANRWKFPDGAVRERWQRVGACLLDTAVDGALVFEVTPERGMHLVARHRSSGRRVWTEGGPSAERCSRDAPTNYSGARL
jgi:competence protein ComEC